MKIDVTSLCNRRSVNRYERLSVGDILERVTWSFPNKEAIVAWEGAYAEKRMERLTYREADELANQFANALLSLGLQRTDRVLFYCGNSSEYLLAQIGTIKAGLVIVPVNVMLAPDLLDYVIRHVEPKCLVVDAEYYPKARHVFEKNGLEPKVMFPIGGDPVQGAKTFLEFIKDMPKTEPEVEIHCDDIFQIQYTAGTTSMPKGVMHSHLYLYVAGIGWAMSHRGLLPTEVDMRSGVFYPIFHIAGQNMAFGTLMCGGTVIFLRRPDPQAMTDVIFREKLTWAFGSPADFYRICEIIEQSPQKYDAGKLKAVAYGWSSFRPDYEKRLRKIFGEDLLVVGNDGQTECVCDTRMWHHKWYRKYEQNEPAVNYLGVPHPFYAITVMDDAGAICSPGVMGHKVMRSPVMMAGYYKDEEATRAAFRLGWLDSGDAAMYDEDGLLIMVDRYKDVIKSGGENVSSIRVEQVLKQHPKVENAAVIGLPHARWGEAVTACVIKKPGETVSEEELIAFCKERLAGYETPKRVVFVESFPQTVGGKIMKYQLRNRLQHLYSEQG